VNTAKPKTGRPALVIGDGGGLWLQVTRGEGDHLRRSWTFRYEIDGRRREMGLGALFTFSLAEARARAKALRQQLADGADPLEAREAARRTKLAEAAKTMTFRQCADAYIELHGDAWGREHLHQWRASLQSYVFPKLGPLAVHDITEAHVMAVVQPIWTSKPTTAGRVRARIENILDFASASGFRDGGHNPAGAIAAALPRRTRLAPVAHFAAMPWAAVPQFMSELRDSQGIAARCLEFLILTAARSGEAIGATWDEIKGDVWEIAASRMKARTLHRVPLSSRAIEILHNLPRTGPFIFGGSKPLQETALRRQVLARLRPGANRVRSTATVHGLRASFKTWASEATAFAPEIVEVALAHKRGDKVERSYERGDLLEKRRRLMQAWSDFLAKPAKQAAGNVVPLKAEA
jgi:integrase